MLFYNIGVAIYTALIHIAAIFNPKAKLWVNGRKNWASNLSNQLLKIGPGARIWIHCASLGEFEQGRPIIEQLKIKDPTLKIILSFFSPSGYEIQKKYNYADIVVYLPPDFKSNAKKFIEMSKPNYVIFVKYEFWLNYLFELRDKKISTYLISAIFRKHQPFFKWYGFNYRKALNVYKKIFVQDSESLELLKKLELNSGILVGDTRIDRVLQIKDSKEELKEIQNFANGSRLIIGGSTWSQDVDILLKAFTKIQFEFEDVKLVIFPHEIDKSTIDSVSKKMNELKLEYNLYSKFSSTSNAKILIVDTIGMLSLSYKYAKIAHIGGGFGNGIHNILEPSVFGLPITFGPKNQKFNEAADLICERGAFEIRSESDFLAIIRKLLRDSDFYNESSFASLNYTFKNRGATEKIINEIF